MPYHLATPQYRGKIRGAGQRVRPAELSLGWVKGFEPSASRATIWRANQLRHTHHSGFRWVEPMLLTSCPPEANPSEKDGTPGGIRTRDLPLRRRLLYPTELQAHMAQVMGIEPTSPAWKAGALAVVLHLQIWQENVSLDMIA